MASKRTKTIETVKAPAKPPAERSPGLAGWLFPAYVALIFLGYLALRAPGAMTAGQEMHQVRALFSAVNAATLTGFSQTVDIAKYPAPGQIIIFALMSFGSILSLTIGGTAVSRILRLGYTDAQCLLAAVAAEIVAIGVGSFFLMFDSERTVAEAGFLAASAFGNCGLTMGNAPDAMSWQTHLVLLPLIAAGGLGLCVLMEMFDRVRGASQSVSEQTLTALRWTAGMYVAGTALMFVLGLWSGVYPGNEATTAQAMRDLAASSATAAVASRTAGMGLVALGQMSRPAMWMVMLLMAIGAASGSTGGGIKTTTLAQIFRGMRGALNGERAERGFGVAIAWAGGFLLLIFVSVLLMLHVMPQVDGDRVLFLAISAASNVGLNHAPLNPDPAAAYVLCATMLIGRFGPMMVLWWMADTQGTDAPAELAVG